ncbi:helix-turn-helix domain-containing protein [Elizabethkingia anophelis]|uniref:helix-turn-helix domain-containing protein n=1 Tax=Elizabethkingia anophelis TaxID=1117645 RepID=UPI00099AF06F|nr:helix-turn-helix domain-containing protein [Elizabethkingia anophelis]MCT4152429.1 helix-turn-helix domain-containing protein [Elizabethkingia anophelis]MCT4315005.1 helix-turn-helix domain-containing protein [Elizabethkingia anophelis]MDV3675083.1 AraC family transcriptional regulator [Elizabethkingia anophelis]MDV3682159.1 AraC family transcriptional regulator [Elizabethkingia anophelis]MDV3701815.1 AraC family transcriptional regulator [Elizabethkingia anophelis]
MIEIIRYSHQTGYSEPRRVVKYTLFWCKEGSAEILIDENIFILEASQLVTITSGQFHQLISVEGDLIALEFTLDFFSKSDSDIELIFHNGLFCHFGMNEIITIYHPTFFTETLNLIEKEVDEKPYQYLISTHSMIELLLVEINRSKIANGDEIWKPDAFFLNFLESVRNHFSENYSVSRFADLLGTTEAKLNEVSKLHTNKTAQNVIYSLIISEAKRLLLYEKLSIKEIAYQLGFNDPFYFSNFFKKYTSLSPKDYQKIIRN